MFEFTHQLHAEATMALEAKEPKLLVGQELAAALHKDVALEVLLQRSVQEILVEESATHVQIETSGHVQIETSGPFFEDTLLFLGGGVTGRPKKEIRNFGGFPCF